MDTWVVILVAVIAALPPTLVAILARRTTSKKLDEIHILVNSRLSEALDKIAVLETIIAEKEK